ncbi:hypothetical protein JCM30760_26870 [Thiomicrorhabdus hydrogeniphila]
MSEAKTTAKEKAKTTTSKAKPAEVKAVKEEALVKEENPTEASATTTEQTNQRNRVSNAVFFSRDILGASQRERLLRDVTFRSRTGKALFNLTYERLDTYLHRPKELATLSIARDTNQELQKIINSRLTELENYVNKRHKKVKNLYAGATELEEFAADTKNDLNAETGFSSSFANRYLTTLAKIDEACFMAGYLEKTGYLDMQQEANLTSELYRKSIQTSRGLMVFIGRAVIGIRKALREQREAS